MLSLTKLYKLYQVVPSCPSCPPIATGTMLGIYIIPVVALCCSSHVCCAIERGAACCATHCTAIVTLTENLALGISRVRVVVNLGAKGAVLIWHVAN